MRSLPAWRIAALLAAGVLVVAASALLLANASGIGQAAHSSAPSGRSSLPPPHASAGSVPSVLPTLPVPSDPVAIDWHRIPLWDLRYPTFPHSTGIASIEGRLFMMGGQEEQPRIWISDDGARTWKNSWRQAQLETGPDWEDVRGSQDAGISEIEGSRSLLVGIGERRVSLTPREVVPVMWLSTDFGESWRLLPMAATPPAESIVWTGTRFMAFNDHPETRGGNADGFSVWTSVDGEDWERQQGAAPLGYEDDYSEQSAFGGHVVALAAPTRDDPLEVWTTDDGARWTRAESGGRPMVASAVSSGPYGFVALDQADPEEPMKTVLRSVDGLRWSSEPVTFENPRNLSGFADTGTTWPPTLGSWWLADGADGLVITAFDPHGQGLMDGTTQVWLLPHGSSRARWEGSGLRGAVWQGAAFFGSEQPCGARWAADFCIGSGGPIIGLPVRDENPGTVTGRFDSAEGSCLELQEPGGHRWGLHLPDGYRIDQPAGGEWLALVDSDAHEIARFGATLTVRGERMLDSADGCPGVDYQVSDIVAVEPPASRTHVPRAMMSFVLPSGWTYRLPDWQSWGPSTPVIHFANQPMHDACVREETESGESTTCLLPVDELKRDGVLIGWWASSEYWNQTPRPLPSGAPYELGGADAVRNDANPNEACGLRATEAEKITVRASPHGWDYVTICSLDLTAATRQELNDLLESIMFDDPSVAPAN